MARLILPHYTPERIQRFWSKVHIGMLRDCWEWEGYRTKGGYGICAGNVHHIVQRHTWTHIE